MGARVSAQLASGAAIALALTALNACDETAPPVTAAPSAADELREPPVFASTHGVLDLLIIAKATPVPQFAPYQASAWAYQVCARPANGARACPGTSANSDLYGGTRLQLSPGDLLKIRLVNQLPANMAAAYWQDSADEFLALNPTNLHTHGVLASPRYSTAADPTWGDNVFVYDFNSANGVPKPGSNLHGTALFDVVDYSIRIPPSHPSGLYWFHPHIHGNSEQQISAGLSGIITIGNVSDYACGGAACDTSPSDGPLTRHLILKDTQVLSDGTLLLHQDPGFCHGSDGGDAANQGGCAGGVPQYPTRFTYTGGRWFFTINGQPYPTITVGAPAGQMWRIVNASANTIYHLNLWDPASQREMLLRVISIDGVGIDVGPGTDPSQLIAQAGNRFQPVACPGADGQRAEGVCTSELHLMPSSRAEVWVTYRDASGAVQLPPPGAAAVLRSSADASDLMAGNWPAIDLAKVPFVQSSTPLSELTRTGPASSPMRAEALASELRMQNAAVPSDSTCSPLAPGHMRRIFFGATAQTLGLGYEEVDAQGASIPGTFIDVAPFDPTTPTLCVPLAPDDQPTTERWQLINITAADHNFHAHQAHFRVVSEAEVAGTAVPDRLNNRSLWMDSLPLSHAEGRCSSVADWRAGSCTAHPAMVDITFAIAGDFVYHCHISAHEDAGMMALIRVRSDASVQSTSSIERLLSAMRGSEVDVQPLVPRIGVAMCRDPREALLRKWPQTGTSDRRLSVDRTVIRPVDYASEGVGR